MIGPADSVSATWGTTASERALPFACDSLLPDADAVLFRAVSVDASPARVFRWLCQLRAAPYSYDWIDNFGRQSPQSLVPGLDALAPGQDVATIFTLVSFEAGVHLTIRLKPQSPTVALFGDVVVTYAIVARAPDACRLIVKIMIRWPRGPLGMVARHLLPSGDLVMMRRQLLNLKRLAERDEESATTAARESRHEPS